MISVTASTTKTTSSSRQEARHHNNKNNNDDTPLPSTLILTPLRNKDENTIGNCQSSTTTSSIRIPPADGQAGQQQQQQHRPVLTLPCYPTTTTDTGISSKIASVTSSSAKIQRITATSKNSSPARTIFGPDNNNNNNTADPKKLILGRNETTRIEDSNLSRNIGTIICTYDEASYIFEFRLTAMRRGMISLNRRKSFGSSSCSTSSSSSNRNRKKGSGHIGASGAILKSGDLISLHDADYKKQYRYRVDITTPQYEEVKDEVVQPMTIIKDDFAAGSSDDTMVNPLLLRQPEPHCNACGDGDDTNKVASSVHNSLSIVSTPCTTVPKTEEQSQTKQATILPIVSSEVLEGPAIKEDPDDTTSSTTNITRSCSSSSSCTVIPEAKPLLTPAQIEQQRLQQEKLELYQRQQQQKSKDIDQQQLTARNHTLDELTCSICMEILVKTHVSHPCGHVFCGPCIEKVMLASNSPADGGGPNHPLFHAFQPPPKLKSCPTCRVEITNCTLMRSYDNVIWNMILMGNFFSGAEAEGDLKHYLHRCGRKISSLTDVEHDCIFGRNPSCREKRHGVSNSGRGDDDDDEDECRIVKRVKTNRTWQPIPFMPLPLEDNGIFDLTEPLTFEIDQGSNIDNPIEL